MTTGTTLTTDPIDALLLAAGGAVAGALAAAANFAPTAIALTNTTASISENTATPSHIKVADIVVIHKADLPGSERTEAQVRDILGLSAGTSAKIVRASSKSGQHIEELWKAIRTTADQVSQSSH